jgi:hypothetical protein
MTQAQRMQEGDNLLGKPQADRENSSPRSPATWDYQQNTHTKELTRKTKKTKPS